MSNKLKILFGIVIGILLFLILRNLLAFPKVGSIGNGLDGYYSTTTDSVWNTSATATTTKLLKNGYGMLGAVVITGTSAAVLNCYDATTTTQGGNGNPVYATSSLIKFFPSTAAGTYSVDSIFNKGLLCETPAGPIPVSTITWK